MFVLALLCAVLLPSMSGAEECHGNYPRYLNGQLRVVDPKLFFNYIVMDATFDFKRKIWLGTPVDPSQASFSQIIVDEVQHAVITWFKNGTCGFFLYDGPYLEGCVPSTLTQVPSSGPTIRYVGEDSQYDVIADRGILYPSTINIGSKKWQFITWGEGNHPSHPNANLMEVCVSKTNSYLSWTL